MQTCGMGYTRGRQGVERTPEANGGQTRGVGYTRGLLGALWQENTMCR